MTSEIDELTQISNEALKRSYVSHQELGTKGLEEIKQNQFGEKALKADWEAEEVVIKTFEEYGIPITIISEEHGRVELGTAFLGILDGLDGTNRYRAFMTGDRRARYGTMFGIFKSTNPSYDDYLTSGVMEHPTKRLVFASKDKGAFIVNIDNDERSAIKVSSARRFDNKIRILVDYYPSEYEFHRTVIKPYVDKLEGFDFRTLRSSEAHYVDLASGEADLVFECTRKGNLEIAVAYGLVTEASGVIITADGSSIGLRKYFEFGQREYIPVVSASTLEVARGFLQNTR